MSPVQPPLRRLSRLAVYVAAPALLVLPGPLLAQGAEPVCSPTTLDFAGLPHGTKLGEQYATQGIHLSAVANEGRPNQLVVFDSNRTGTPDPDLEVDIGNLAIIPENVTDANGDGLVDRPSDSIRGGRQIYTFDQARTVGSFTIVDIDHGHPSSQYAAAYDAAGALITRVPILIGSDGNVQTVDVNASGVRRLEIVYRDSAGVTDVEVGCPPGGGGGGQGCTPGYWKQAHHFDSWTAPYDPADLFDAHFENAFPGMTLLQVLSQGGGGLNALGRHTVAALLNSASPGVDYAYTPSGVVDAFNTAFPGSNATYEGLKNDFAAANESGCPLN